MPKREQAIKALLTERQQRKKEVNDVPGKPDPVPITINSLTGLYAFLDVHGISVRKWNDDALYELWDELKCGESVLTFGSDVRVIRNIKTVTIRVYYDLPSKDTAGASLNANRLFLRERREFKDDRPTKERAHPNSLSEKMPWDELSTVEEVRRAFHEELKKRSTGERVVLSDEEMVQCVMRDPHSPQNMFVALHESEKFPGLLTQNELHPYICILPERHFDPKGYIEETHRRTSYFFWTPVGGKHKT